MATSKPSLLLPQGTQTHSAWEENWEWAENSKSNPVEVTEDVSESEFEFSETDSEYEIESEPELENEGFSEIRLIKKIATNYTREYVRIYEKNKRTEAKFEEERQIWEKEKADHEAERQIWEEEKAELNKRLNTSEEEWLRRFFDLSQDLEDTKADHEAKHQIWEKELKFQTEQAEKCYAELQVFKEKYRKEEQELNLARKKLAWEVVKKENLILDYDELKNKFKSQFRIVENLNSENYELKEQRGKLEEKLAAANYALTSIKRNLSCYENS